jgi:hypothetical protein
VPTNLQSFRDAGDASALKPDAKVTVYVVQAEDGTVTAARIFVSVL